MVEDFGRELSRLLQELRRNPRSELTRGSALRLSAVLEEKGQTEQAAKILEAALAADPASAELRLELVMLFERAGRADRAVGAALSGTPPPEARLTIAHLLIRQGRFAQAEDVLRAGVPAGFEAERTWGRVHRWQHRYEEAARSFERALALQPDALEVHLWLAESRLNQERLDETFAALARARDACPAPAPSDLPALLRRFRLLLVSLDYEGAAAVGERVLDATRKAEDLEWLQFQIFTEEFDFTPRPPAYVEKALAALDGLADRRPDSPWAFYFRGMMGELAAGREAARDADFRRLRSFPAERYGWMRYKTGLHLMYRDELEEAAEDFALAARASRPGHWKSQAFLVEVLLALGDAAGAERALEGLAEMIPPRDQAHSDHGECLAQQGKLLLWLGRYERALAVLDRALAHTSYDAACWKGACLVKLGRHAEALTWLDQAVRHTFTPSCPEAALWRAEALLRLGRHAEALDACGPERAESRFNLFDAALRGLAKDGLGDAEGLKRETDRLPPGLLERLRRASGVSGDSGADRRRLLEKTLALAGGVRADDGRARLVWLRG